MASQRSEANSVKPAVTADRAARLYQLINLLGAAPRTRGEILRELDIEVRKFYRDLDLVRRLGVDLVVEDQQYVLKDKLEEALAAVPFPDPGLSLHEAIQLAQGRTAAHRGLRQAVEEFTGRPFRSRPKTKPKR